MGPEQRRTVVDEYGRRLTLARAEIEALFDRAEAGDEDPYVQRRIREIMAQTERDLDELHGLVLAANGLPPEGACS